MNSLATAFRILADTGASADRKETMHSFAKLLVQADNASGVTLGALTNHFANHFQAVDISVFPNPMAEANDPVLSDQKLAEFDSILTNNLFGCKDKDLGFSLRSEKKVDFAKLYAEASPPPIESIALASVISYPTTARVISPVVPSNIPPLSNNPQIAGVKRLGGFRPPVALPPPTVNNVQQTQVEEEEDDDEYEPDPKIRAKKQWRKQYDAAKKREAERKYNTAKYADDSENNIRGKNSSFPKSNSNTEFCPPPPLPQQTQPPRPAVQPSLGGARPGFRPASKFVSPLLKKNNSDEQQQQQAQVDGTVKHNFIKTALNNGAELQQQDERLKTLDSAMIELILGDIVDHGPKIEWEDVAGLEIVKKNILEVIVWPMLRPDLFRGIRGPPKGLLLFGPPGTGKTMIGKCIASQCNATFFSISASSLLSKWFGEAEKMVKTLFAVARTRQPAVIFIDEVDSMLCKRGQDDQECSRRIKTEFLVQLDGVTCGEDDRILMIGATNLPSELDEAARRRFGKRLYVALPGQIARVQIVRRLMGKLDTGQCTLSDDDYEEVGRRSEGYSGSDMTNLCREAALGPLRSVMDITTASLTEIRPVILSDFQAAFNSVRPSVAPKDLVELEAWNFQYGTINAE